MSMTSEALTDNLLTTENLCRLFKRGEMTIYLWRRNKNLPFVQVGGGNRPLIRFKKREILRWAKVNNKVVHEQ